MRDQITKLRSPLRPIPKPWAVIRAHGGGLAVVHGDGVRAGVPVLFEAHSQHEAMRELERLDNRYREAKILAKGIAWTVFVLGAVVTMAWSTGAFAATIDELTWTAPTQNVDGSPLTDLAGFKIYIGEGSRSYSVEQPVNDATATTATVTFTADWLVPGLNDVYIAMTALDTSGNESAFSNEVLRQILVTDDIPPRAPIVITVTITIGIDCPPGFSCPVVVQP